MSKTPPFYNAELYHETNNFVIKRNGVVLHSFKNVVNLNYADTLIQDKGFVKKYNWGIIKSPHGMISVCSLKTKESQL